MSREEFNGILKGVTLAQVFNGIFIIGSLSVGGAFGVAAIRGDITANAVTEQIHHIENKHGLDSLGREVSSIKNDVSDVKSDMAEMWKMLRGSASTKNRSPQFVTSFKDANGNITWREYKP